MDARNKARNGTRRKAPGVRTTDEIAEELLVKLGSPAMLRGIAEYYSWLYQAKTSWSKLDRVLARLEADLEVVLGSSRFAFRQWSRSTIEKPGGRPAVQVSAEEMLEAVRRERRARAEALRGAEAAGGKPHPARTRAEASLPFVGKPSIAAQFAYAALIDWWLGPADMAKIESLVAQNYFDGLRIDVKSVSLYGRSPTESRSATDRWRKAVEPLGFTPAQVQGAIALSKRKRK